MGRNRTRGLFALLQVAALVACAPGSGPSADRARVTAAFPGAADRLFEQTAFEVEGDAFVLTDHERSPLRAQLPAPSSSPATLSLRGGPSVQVRELGLSAVGKVEHGAIVYAHEGGASWWVATERGVEEWIEVFDAGEGPVAQWEVTGARVRQVGDEVLVEAGGDTGALHVAARVAFGPGGTRERAWLTVEGSRLSLFTSARGHALVDPSWTFTATSMPTPLVGHTTTLLPNGKVLVTGGTASSMNASVYDPATGAWATTASMNPSAYRSGHTATLLRDGRLMVAGGAASTAATPLATSTTAFFAWASSSWSAGSPPMAMGRWKHTATLLNDGRVLVVGGQASGSASALGSAEVFTPSSPGFGTWALLAATLATPRMNHTATLLPNGKVLISGGFGGGLNPTALQTAELFDPAGAGSFTAIAQPMSTKRAEHAAMLQPNGRVLVVGGYNDAGTLASAEQFDPSGAGSWTPTTGSLAVARAGPAATLLPSGKVLVAGGYGLPASGAPSSTELYDPATQTFVDGGTLQNGRSTIGAVLLPSGSVLLAGGGGGSPDTAELLDTTQGSWSTTSSLGTARRGHRATTLADGRVFVSGGYASVSYLSSTELFSPDAGSWSGGPALPSPRAGHSATLLRTGQVLLTGGQDSTSVLFTSDLFDPRGNTMRRVGSLNAARFGHTATLLDDGRVLVSGGWSGTSLVVSAELFEPRTETWTTYVYPSGCSNPSYRLQATATRAFDGSVVFSGGTNAFFTTLPTPLVEIWNVGAGTCAELSLTTGRILSTALLLPSGEILVAGGLAGYNPQTAFVGVDRVRFDGPSWSAAPLTPLGRARYNSAAAVLTTGQPLFIGGAASSPLPAPESTSELGALKQNPATWVATNALAAPYLTPVIASLANGAVLIAGGEGTSLTASAACQLYDEGRGAIPSAIPFLAPLPLPLTTPPTATVTLTGSGFTGLSEGSAGTTAASGGNSPIVQLQEVNGDLLVHLGAASWTATSLTFNVPGLGAPPSLLPYGLYWLRVIVNAVPSNPRLLVVLDPNVSLALPGAAVPPRGSAALSASGGANGAYTYTFVTNNSDAGLTGSQYVAGPIGNVSDLVRVTDPWGNTTSGTITVGPQVSLTPSTATRPPRGSLTLATSGGDSTYSHSIQTDGSGCTFDGGTYVAGPVGNTTDVLFAQDSLGNSAISTITVGPGVALAPATMTVPPRKVVTLVASGGAGAPFLWSLDGGSGGSVSDAGLYAAGSSGRTTDVVLASDALGNSAVSIITIGPGITLTPSQPSFAPRQTVTFVADGGAGAPYAWSTTASPDGGPTIDAVTGAFFAGTLENTIGGVVVTDALGNTATAKFSVGAGVHLAPQSQSVPPRGLLAFTADGGVGPPFTWSLTANQSGGSIDPVSGSYRAGPADAGVDTVQVSDALGNLDSTTVTVSNGLRLNPTQASVAPKGGQSFVAAGGLGPYTWAFKTNASGATLTSVGTNDKYDYRAGATGGVTDVFEVSDALGNLVDVTVSVGAAITIAPSSASVPPNGTQTFTATGGSGQAYTWDVTTRGSGLAAVTSSGRYTAGALGSTTDVVTVSDSLMNTAQVTVTVTPGVSITPDTATVSPRGTLQLTGSGGSGTGFTWKLAINASGGSVSAAGLYTAGGTGNVSDEVSLKDALGNTATATITVGEPLAVDPRAANVAPLGTVTFTATGGAGALTWRMSINGSGGDVTNQGVYTAGPKGGVTDEVEVADSGKATAHATITVEAESTVSKTPFRERAPVSGFSCGCNASSPEGSGSGAVVALLGIGLLLARRRAPAAALVGLALVLALPAVAATPKKAAGKAVAPKEKHAPVAPTAETPAPAPPPPAAVAAPAPAAAPPAAVAAPAPPVKKDRLTAAVLDVEVSVPNEKLDGMAFSELLMSSVDGTQHFKVISTRDMVTMLGLERQKQLMGCSEDSSCMAEFANALGSDLLVACNVGKVGEAYLVTTKLIDGRGSRVVGRASVQAKTPTGLLSAIWTSSQQALEAYGQGLMGAEAERWTRRPKQAPPAAVVESEGAGSAAFGLSVFAVGGYQVLSVPGKRGSVGAELDLTWRKGRLDFAGGLVISPTLGARVAITFALLDDKARLALGVRGTGYPGVGLFGAGPTAFFEYPLTSVFALAANGSAEFSPAPQGELVVVLLASAGVAAHF